MKKKKTVKKVAAKKPVKVAKIKKTVSENAVLSAGVAEPKDFARHAMQLGTQNMKVLDHILELFKAQMYDAFRQFVAGAIGAGLTPSLNGFISLFKASLTLHGISPEQLVSALDKTEQDIVMEALEASTKGQKKKESDKPKAPAENVDLTGFGIATPAKTEAQAAPATPAKAEKAPAGKEQANGVFSSLDVL